MAFRILLPLVLLFSSTYVTQSAPIFGIGDTSSEEAVSLLPTDQTNMFIKPARFSQVAYCSSASVLSWSCGAPCDALPGVEPIVAGGDGGKIPLYYIAYDRIAGSIVVAHQGTDRHKMKSIANDVKILLEPLDKTLFPGVDSSIKSHAGFAAAFGRTANDILGNVTAALTSRGVNKVEVHGHSLGAAIAVVTALFLRLNFPPEISVNVTTFANPRGGNQAWANYVDKHLKVVHVHRGDDLIGILPPRILGFRHPSGEIHIQANGSSVYCPGQENRDPQCVGGQKLRNASLADHRGPFFDNISMGSDACPK